MSAERRLATHVAQTPSSGSSLAAPLGATVAGWVVTGGVAVLALAARARLDEQLLVAALFGWPGAVAAFLGWGLWFRAQRARRRVLQEATLVGARLRVVWPDACDVDLEREHAIVLGVTDAHASVRVLRSTGDVVLHVERTADPRSLPGVPPAEPVEWTGASVLGVPEARRAFGDALVAAVLAARPQNRYETWLATLRALEVDRPSDPRVIALADPAPEPAGSDLDAGAYRSGRAAPGEPGYHALLGREGRALAEGLVVGPEHLVARDGVGTWRAFPIGSVRATRSAGVLRLGAATPASAGASDEEASIPVEDPALSCALALWLEEQASAAHA